MAKTDFVDFPHSFVFTYSTWYRELWLTHCLNGRCSHLQQHTQRKICGSKSMVRLHHYIESIQSLKKLFTSLKYWSDGMFQLDISLNTFTRLPKHWQDTRDSQGAAPWGLFIVHFSLTHESRTCWKGRMLQTSNITSCPVMSSSAIDFNFCQKFTLQKSSISVHEQNISG